MALPIALRNVIHSIPAEYFNEFFKAVSGSPATKAKLNAIGIRSVPDLIQAFYKEDKSLYEQMYHCVEPILLVGGFLPMVGVVFNVLDAVFCYLLGRWVDFVIDVICIAFCGVPGLKGAFKTLVPLCKHVKIRGMQLLDGVVKKTKVFGFGTPSTKEVSAVLKEMSNVLEKMVGNLSAGIEDALEIIAKKTASAATHGTAIHGPATFGTVNPAVSPKKWNSIFTIEESVYKIPPYDLREKYAIIDGGRQLVGKSFYEFRSTNAARLWGSSFSIFK